MRDPIDLHTVIARRNDLMTSELSDNELVMLDIDCGAYYGMEETAKAIWDDLVEPRTIAALVAHLRTLFAVDQETCERETLAFVGEMLTDGLVRVVDGSEGA